MKRFLAVVVLSGAVAVPAFAAGDASDPTCADYMAMDSAGRMKAVEQMDSSATPMDAAKAESTTGEGGGAMSADEMATGQGTSSGTMGTDMMVANAEKACSAHSDGTVAEALKMMAGS